MTVEEKILVPIDVEDESSKKVLKYVSKLAKNVDRNFIIMYVVPFNPPYGVIDEIASRDAVERSLVKIKETAEKNLRRCLENEQIKGGNISIRVVNGDPADRILKMAEVEKVNLIVMGNRCNKIGCRFFGSVAFKVIQESPTPVTIIPTNS